MVVVLVVVVVVQDVVDVAHQHEQSVHGVVVVGACVVVMFGAEQPTYPMSPQFGVYDGAWQVQGSPLTPYPEQLPACQIQPK